MKFNKTTAWINAGLFVLIGGYGFSAGAMAGLGIAAFLIGLLNILIVLISFVAGQKQMIETAWIFMAIWLLIGFSVCTSTGLGNLH